MMPPEEQERARERELAAYHNEELARRQAYLQEAERIHRRWEWGRRKTTLFRVVLALAWLVIIVLAVAFFARRINMPSAIPPPTANPTNGPLGPSGPPPVSAQVNTESLALADLRAGFVTVPAGEFMMGSDSGNAGEKPAHRVRISQPFEMGKTEVTQAQWEAVMGNRPSYFGGDTRPVEQVSWYDAQEFIGRLNGLDDGYVYRLPTEAEWEYACRAGSSGDYAGKLEAMAWCDENSQQMTHAVGTKQPNAWGLYDMHGNVFEWCQDYYDAGYYAQSPGVDPQGPESGSFRVKRGGGWMFSAAFARSAARDLFSPAYRYNFVGFRLVRTRR
ncbi:MAG TPA: formylglycine-generating enzyme family protein [Blastocatellia bacterium]|nr:formylglycine-generating enzyme family protein [Blastocatellia bacterium]